MELHRAIDDAISHTIDDQGKESDKLKKRITKLEATLIPRPLFAKPLAIV